MKKLIGYLIFAVVMWAAFCFILWALLVPFVLAAKVALLLLAAGAGIYTVFMSLLMLIIFAIDLIRKD